MKAQLIGIFLTSSYNLVHFSSFKCCHIAHELLPHFLYVMFWCLRFLPSILSAQKILPNCQPFSFLFNQSKRHIFTVYKKDYSTTKATQRNLFSWGGGEWLKYSFQQSYGNKQLSMLFYLLVSATKYLIKAVSERIYFYSQNTVCSKKLQEQVMGFL